MGGSYLTRFVCVLLMTLQLIAQYIRGPGIVTQARENYQEFVITAIYTSGPVYIRVVL